MFLQFILSSYFVKSIYSYIFKKSCCQLLYCGCWWRSLWVLHFSEISFSVNYPTQVNQLICQKPTITFTVRWISFFDDIKTLDQIAFDRQVEFQLIEINFGHLIEIQFGHLIEIQFGHLIEIQFGHLIESKFSLATWSNSENLT
jgi:hypothetical protein